MGKGSGVGSLFLPPGEKEGRCLCLWGMGMELHGEGH